MSRVLSARRKRVSWWWLEMYPRSPASVARRFPRRRRTVAVTFDLATDPHRIPVVRTHRVGNGAVPAEETALH